MPSLSPMIFSPRPPQDTKTLQLASRPATGRTKHTQFSYVVSSNGIEIRQPQKSQEIDHVTTANSTDKTHCLLSDIEEALSNPTGSGAFTSDSVAALVHPDTLSLCQRRGKHFPNLSLEPSLECLQVDETSSSPLSQETLVESFGSLDEEVYEIIKQVGHDSEGPCTLIRRKKNFQLRVVKSVRQPTMAYGKPIEGKILLETFPQRHPNIIQLHHYEFTEQIGLVQYYLEYCSGGDLHELCMQYELHNARFPELFIWKAFRQLTEALEFLHRGFDQRMSDRPGIVHRDIKPQNIFVRRHEYCLEYPNVVIADFGTATFDFATYEPAGTFTWQPPEIPRKTPKGDVWSLGAIIHQMIHLTPPIIALPEDIEPTSTNEYLWEANPAARSPILETPEIYSHQLVHMMLFALEMDHNKRAGSARLLTVLKAVMEESCPSDAEGIMGLEPLAEWAFDHIDKDRVDSARSDTTEVEYESEGTKQYFDMMDRLWCRTRSIS